MVTSTWWADPARLAELSLRVRQAIEALAAIATGLRGQMAEHRLVPVLAELTTQWLAPIGRAAASDALTSWSAIGAPRWPSGAVALADGPLVAAGGIVDDGAGRERDEANRGQLLADLASPDAQLRANAEAAQRYLDVAAAHVDPITGQPVEVQLLIYEPTELGGVGRYAMATGDVGSAAHVVFAVPGFNSDIAALDPAEVQGLYDAARQAGSGDESVAVVEWMGYDAPSFDAVFPASLYGGAPSIESAIWEVLAVTGMNAAAAGGSLLAGDVRTLIDRPGVDGREVHVTVLGHSYGSTTVAIAAAEFDLAADDVVLTGSPGAGTAATADDLVTGRDHTWVASPSADAVTYLGHNDGGMRVFGALGNDPAMDTFGAQRVQAERAGRGSGLNPANLAVEHQSQLAPGSESLGNVAAIVVADYAAVRRAEPRTQRPLLTFNLGAPLLLDANLWPVDPEAERVPT